MSVICMAMFCSMVPTICAPVMATEAVMLKVPLGFMGMPLEVLSVFSLVGKEMGNVMVPMVTESGIMDIIEPPPPKFIV